MNRSVITNLIGLASLATVLGACSSPGATVANAPTTLVALPGSYTGARHAAHRGWLSREAKTGKNLLYVSSSGNGSVGSGVYIYSTKGQSQSPIGVITDGVSAAQGIGVDSQGNLYVANSGANTVTEYAPGATSPSTTYTSGIGIPYDVKVGTDGRVYVANVSASPSGFGTVSEYPPGSTDPDITIVNPGFVATSLALDANNNLYVGWWSYTAYGPSVLEYAPGSTSGTNLGLDLPGGSFPEYGMAFDHNGNLAMWYESLDHSVKYLAAFPPGKTEPSIQIQGGSFLSNVFGIVFTRKGSPYVATPNKNLAVLLTYPKGLPRNVINLGTASGIAVSPGT